MKHKLTPNQMLVLQRHFEVVDSHKGIEKTMKELIRKSYLNATKVIVAGGRDFDDYDFMHKKLVEVLYVEDNFGDQCAFKIISGMADGADTLAIRFADEEKLAKILFPANWKGEGRMAGFLRNEDMLVIADVFVAFWDGESHGTKHMIEIAREKGIPVWVFNYDKKRRFP